MRKDVDDGVTLYSCARCGSINVQCLEWVDANLPIVIGTTESRTDDDSWCEDCDDHTELKVERVAREEFDRRLAGRRASHRD